MNKKAFAEEFDPGEIIEEVREREKVIQRMRLFPQYFTKCGLTLKNNGENEDCQACRERTKLGFTRNHSEFARTRQNSPELTGLTVKSLWARLKPLGTNFEIYLKCH